MRTHYDNLKIAENAPDEVVKAAYRALCQRYHPDKNPGNKSAGRIMQILNDAYFTLSDQNRRRQYDDFLAKKRSESGRSYSGQSSPGSNPRAPHPPQKQRSNADWWILIANARQFFVSGLSRIKWGSLTLYFISPVLLCWGIWLIENGSFMEPDARHHDEQLGARLVSVSEACALKGRNNPAPVYLKGRFWVTSVDRNRAVMRQEGSDPKAPPVRVIVEYPPGALPPSQGSAISREDGRGFEIREVRRGPDGTTNIFVHENPKIQPVADNPSIHIGDQATLDEPTSQGRAGDLSENHIQSLDPVGTGVRSSFGDFQSEVEELLKGNVPQNSEAVINATLAAAKQGNTQAQYAMGVICYVGKAVSLDYHAAVKWFSLAAKNGHLKAIRNLGTCYKRGYGVPIDLPKSVDYYTQAAKGGDSDAQCNLAAAYLLGQGVTKNEKIGFNWLKMAADQGNAMAEAMLLQAGK
jgi:hypothetical protein